MSDGTLESSDAWSYNSEGGVACLAVVPETSRVIVCARGGSVYFLNANGVLGATVQVGSPAVQVRASRDGAVVAALLDDGNIVGFSPDYRQLWQFRPQKRPTFLDLSPSGRRLAAATSSCAYYTYWVEENKLEECEAADPVASVALVDGPPEGIVLADEKGHMRFVNSEGDVLWDHNLKQRCAGLRVDARGKVIVLPVFRRGLQTFNLQGQGAGAFELEESIIDAALTADGTLILARTDKDGIILMDCDANVLWYRYFEEKVADFAMNEDASFLVVGLQDGNVAALQLHQEGKAVAAGDLPPAQEAEGIPPESVFDFSEEDFSEEIAEEENWGGTGDVESPEPEADAQVPERESVLGTEVLSPYPTVVSAPQEDEVQEGEFGGPPQPATPATIEPAVSAVARAQVLWKKRLPGNVPPPRRAQFFLTDAGEFLVMAFKTGQVLVLNEAGEQVQKARLKAAGMVKKKRRGEPRVLVWNSNEAVILDPTRDAVQSVPLGTFAARYLDCSAPPDVVCFIDERNRLSVVSKNRTLWEKDISPAPRAVYVSPNAETVLVIDAERRYRFFDARGKLVRKQRFAGGTDFRHVVLENTFYALCSPGGKTVIFDSSGTRLWDGRAADRVSEMTVINETLAVFDGSRLCKLIEPTGEAVWEFAPDPGICTLRRPVTSTPVLLHARGSTFTVFGGSRTSLNALWNFECEDDISTFEADGKAQRVAILAGDKIYLLQAPL